MLEVEVGEDVALAVGGLAQHDAPRIHDHRAPSRVLSGGMLAELVGGDHEGLVLDRAGAHERAPVIARGGQRERGGQRHDPRPADGEDAEQLGEAQVVADRQAQLDACGGAREHDLLARLLQRRLAVGAPADLHVEHVNLAVHRR